jgi:hypothetical protein
MPPRLSKRQQREQEELQTLGGSVDAAISSDDDKTSVPLKVSGAGFSAVSDIDLTCTYISRLTRYPAVCPGG